jgi:HSP20 family protein
MTLVRWDPFREVVTLQERVNRVFSDLYGRSASEDLSGRWTPAVDIYESPDALVLKAELPDVKREDIQITVENGLLTLSGERKVDSDVRQDQYHRIERSYGAFSRSFSLPSTVDGSNASADYKNGVLTIRLPRREDAKPKQIDIQAA